MNPDDPDRLLLRIARDAIAAELDRRPYRLPRELPADWSTPAATFVTLTLDGDLRGCIGSLRAQRPLAEDVAHNAVQSAFDDPRFPPLTREEFPRIRIDISILSPPEPFPVQDEEDLLRRLRPGVDGLILIEGARRATFLPAVWEDLPDPRDFLRHLKRKAGLPADHWSPALRFELYTARKISERD